MSDFSEHLAEQLKDPVFREEYERLQPEVEKIMAMISGCNNESTEEKSATKEGNLQSDLSNI